MLLSVSIKQAPAAMFAGSIIKPVNRRYIQHSPTVNTTPSWGPGDPTFSDTPISCVQPIAGAVSIVASLHSKPAAQKLKGVRMQGKYLSIYAYIYI